MLERIRVWHQDFKEVFAFEDAEREARNLIATADPGAIIVLMVTPSARIQEKLDIIQHSREDGGTPLDSIFHTAQLLQQEWDRFFEKLPPDEALGIDMLDEGSMIRAFVTGRCGVKGTYLRFKLQRTYRYCAEPIKAKTAFVVRSFLRTRGLLDS